MRRAFGLSFSTLCQAELVRDIVGRSIEPGSGPRTVLTANVDHIAQLTRSAEFRECYERAWVVTADGMPVYVYARLKGIAVPERLTGADLFGALMWSLSPPRHRCFFVASSHATADRLRTFLVGRGFSAEALAFEVPPFGFDRDETYSADLVDRIARHRTTHLFMGVGAPKSELWTARARDRLGDCFVLHVGAGLDFFAGRRRRAPVWMQRAGFEWLWRLGQEPRRLAKRYLVDSWRFVGAIVDDLRAGPASSRAPSS